MPTAHAGRHAGGAPCSPANALAAAPACCLRLLAACKLHWRPAPAGRPSKTRAMTATSPFEAQQQAAAPQDGATYNPRNILVTGGAGEAPARNVHA